MQKLPITLEWVTFLNSTALEAGLLRFKDAIDEKVWVNIGPKTIRDVNMGYYVLSYPSSEQANEDYEAFQKLYETRESSSAIIPKMVTIFEYNGLTHIGVSVEEKIDKTKELMGVEYQWFIVNPILFIQQGAVKDDVSKLL